MEGSAVRGRERSEVCSRDASGVGTGEGDKSGMIFED